MTLGVPENTTWFYIISISWEMLCLNKYGETNANFADMHACCNNLSYTVRLNFMVQENYDKPNWLKIESFSKWWYNSPSEQVVKATSVQNFR